MNKQTAKEILEIFYAIGYGDYQINFEKIMEGRKNV